MTSTSKNIRPSSITLALTAVIVLGITGCSSPLTSTSSGANQPPIGGDIEGRFVGTSTLTAKVTSGNFPPNLGPTEATATFNLIEVSGSIAGSGQVQADKSGYTIKSLQGAHSGREVILKTVLNPDYCPNTITLKGTLEGNDLVILAGSVPLSCANYYIGTASWTAFTLKKQL
jgi:hypothetical protein